MEKIIIFGLTSHSLMMKNIIEQEGKGLIVAFSKNKKFITDSDYDIVNKYNSKLIPYEDISDFYSKDEVKIFNSIGYSSMNRIREQIHHLCINDGYNLYTFISDKATVLSNIDNGLGISILPNAYIGPNVNIEENCVIYSGSIITHDIKIGKNVFIAAGAVVGGHVLIGNNCFIGLNATIKNRVSMSSYTLLGAGTYLNCDTNTYEVYVPERSIKINKLSTDLI